MAWCHLDLKDYMDEWLNLSSHTDLFSMDATGKS